MRPSQCRPRAGSHDIRRAERRVVTLKRERIGLWRTAATVSEPPGGSRLGACPGGRTGEARPDTDSAGSPKHPNMRRALRPRSRGIHDEPVSRSAPTGRPSPSQLGVGGAALSTTFLAGLLVDVRRAPADRRRLLGHVTVVERLTRWPVCFCRSSSASSPWRWSELRPPRCWRPFGLPSSSSTRRSPG